MSPFPNECRKRGVDDLSSEPVDPRLQRNARRLADRWRVRNGFRSVGRDSLVSREDLDREVIRQRAIAAFESLSAQAQKNLDHEPTLDEINAIIGEVRKERNERERANGRKTPILRHDEF